MFKKKQLTERQRDILESAGLPTEWDKLSGIQQSAIVEIEKRLRHLERKYHKKFCFNKELNYYLVDGLGELIVYAEGDDPKKYSFMIRRKDSFFGYEDTYDGIIAYFKAKKYVEDKMSLVMSDQTYQVYSRILGVEWEKPTSISVTIILDNSDEEYCDEVFENIYNEVKDDKLIEYVTMYCVDTGSIDEFNEENYRKVHESEICRIRYYYSVDNKKCGDPDCEKKRLR
jgi:Icc-related predicted phosphoesterase